VATDAQVLTFQTERWSDAVAEIQRWTNDHWSMLALNKESVPLAVKWGLYKANETLGRLHLMTVRADKELVGYYVSFVDTHPHYGNTLFGMVDAYYIRPEFRAPTTGLEFLEALEEEMRKLGVKCLISTTKRHLDLSPLFERCGWQEAGKTFTKVLS
jgi:GNAT superfamily N-acetyltransferase